MLKAFSNVFACELPTLVLGTWQLGGAYRFGGKPDGLGRIDPKTAEALLHKAYRGGIRIFDTADIYGRGKVESMLSHLPRDTFIVTKFGNRGTTETRRKDFGRAYLLESLEKSRGRLSRVPDLVLMHNPPSDFDFTLLDALEIDQLRNDRLLKGFGVSCGTISQALNAIKNEWVQAIEVNFNLLDRRAEAILFEHADEMKKDIFLRAPLCSGFLTERFLANDYNFQTDDRRSTMSLEDRTWRIHAARKLQSELATKDIVELALRFCLSFKRFTVVGCRSLQQLETNLRYAELGGLDERTIQRIELIELGVNPCWST